MVYALHERIEIISLYYENHHSAFIAARIFNNRHPERNTSHTYISKLVNRFTQTGSVCNIKKRPQQPARNEETQIAVLGHVALNPRASTRQLSRETGVSQSSVCRILKSQKFHPYKIHLVHELNEDDDDRRLEFCDSMTQRLMDNPNLLFNICFSDESAFFLNGNINRHNCRYWSDSNPRITREAHTQSPQKLNVWAGIFGNKIIGPLFFDNNLDGDNYLNLLGEHIEPMITEAIESDPNYSEVDIHFQQDGAPPHYALAVREFLNTTFPGQWIGRRGPIEWPARSPDLTPLDFFLWGYLKNKVYLTVPNSLEELRERIVNECRLITPDILTSVREEFERRLYFCMEVGGGHFEQLLN